VTTNEDLGGFWDMVMIQVEQVYALFQKLEGIEPANSVSQLEIVWLRMRLYNCKLSNIYY